MLLGSACTREIIREVTKTDTLEVIKTDTLIVKDTITDTLFVRDTVCATDSCLRAGLLVYYPFSGDFNDASGNGYHLTPMNGVSFGPDAAGRANNAASFDGVDDYLFVNDGGKLYSEQFTISLWFKSRENSKPQSFCSHTSFEDASGFHLNAGIDKQRSTGFALGRPSLGCAAIQHYDPSISVATPQPVVNDVWHSFIGIFDNGKMYVYVDGQLKATKTAGYTTSNRCTNARLTLGAWWKDDLTVLNGLLDEFRLYNRPLNPCEIAYLSSKR